MDVILLDVPYFEKELVKKLGASWNPFKKKWYITSDMDAAPFAKWLAADTITPTEPELATEASVEQGISLTEYLNRIEQVVAGAMSSPEWIRAEVSSFSDKGNHCYLELVDSGDDGKQISKCRAVIWQNRVEYVLSNFQQVTGSDLQPGMKILLQGKARFHMLYGLSIQVEDIDPSYTIGNLVAKLNVIRKKLQQAGIYERNKALEMPRDFTNVAVISPTKAAGLGDFKREADLLAKYGLCNFTYYESLFQGKEAAQEIAAQMAAVMADNKERFYDALVIIRGGGAVTDLAWLNDYDIANEICNAPIPVLSGIGHERDNTIVDEVACCRFDTPSKVIKHIFHTIVSNAEDSERGINGIFRQAGFLLEQNQSWLKAVFTACMREAQHKIEVQQKEIFAISNEVLTFAQYKTNRIQHDVHRRFDGIVSGCGRVIEKLADKLRFFGQLIEFANPLKILQRGFALVRSCDGKVVTSRERALQSFKNDRELQLIFADGDLAITGVKQDKS